MNDYWQRQHVLSFKIFYYSITFLLLIFITFDIKWAVNNSNYETNYQGESEIYILH